MRQLIFLLTLATVATASFAAGRSTAPVAISPGAPGPEPATTTVQTTVTPYDSARAFLTGRVVDEAGHPVDGAVVVARRADSLGVQLNASYRPSFGEPPVDLAREGVVTDPSGQFTISGLPPGRYILVAIHGHHSPGRSGPVVVASQGLPFQVEVTLGSETIPA